MGVSELDGARIRFINANEPVVSIYRDIFPALLREGAEVEVHVIDDQYREERRPLQKEINHPRFRVVHYSAPSSSNPALDKTSKTASFTLKLLLRAIWGDPADLNLFLTQPPLIFLAGPGLSMLRNQSWACILMDIYPEFAGKAGYLEPSGILYSAAQWLAHRSLSRANHVISIGRCMQQQVQEMGVDADRISLIPNWADEAVVKPVEEESNPLRTRLGLKERFVVGYSGNMGASHQFEDFIEAADRLRNHEDIHFVLIGTGIRRPEIEEDVESRGLENVTFHPFVSREDLSVGLSLPDIHFVSLREGFEGLVVPSKAYGIMAAGRPMIYQGHRSGEIARMVEEEEIGSVVEPDDVDGLTKTIEDYANEPARTREEGCRARKLIDGKYSRDRRVHEYVELIAELV